MGTQTVQRRMAHPALALLFLFLQSIGTEIATGSTTVLLYNVQNSVVCDFRNVQPEPSASDPCPLSFGALNASRQTYDNIILLLSLLMAGPFARLMDIRGPGRRGHAMAVCATFMALGDVLLYICGALSSVETYAPLANKSA